MKTVGVMAVALLIAGCAEDRLCAEVLPVEGVLIRVQNLSPPDNGVVNLRAPPEYTVDLVADGTALSIPLRIGGTATQDHVTATSEYLGDAFIVSNIDSDGQIHGGPAEVEVTLNHFGVMIAQDTFRPAYKMVEVNGHGCGVSTQAFVTLVAP